MANAPRAGSRRQTARDRWCLREELASRRARLASGVPGHGRRCSYLGQTSTPRRYWSRSEVLSVPAPCDASSRSAGTESHATPHSQTRAVPSPLAVTTRLPSGLKAALLRKSALLGRLSSCAPLFASQIRAVPSPPAVTTRSPSGLKAASSTDASWPRSSVCHRRPRPPFPACSPTRRFPPCGPLRRPAVRSIVDRSQAIDLLSLPGLRPARVASARWPRFVVAARQFRRQRPALRAAEESHRPPGEPQRPAVLADVLADELVLGHAVQGSRELADAVSKRGFRIDTSRSSRAQRRSTHSGSPRATREGPADAASASKSPPASSQWKLAGGQGDQVVSRLLCSRHQRTSRSTQCEAADSGDARSTKKRACSSARSIAGHSSGEAERLVLSRKTRSARSRYHGFASERRPACRAGPGGHRPRDCRRGRRRRHLRGARAAEALGRCLVVAATIDTPSRYSEATTPFGFRERVGLTPLSRLFESGGMSLKRLPLDDLAVPKPVGPCALALASNLARFDPPDFVSRPVENWSTPSTVENWSTQKG